MTVSDTPAKDIPTKDLNSNSLALSECLKLIKTPPKTVLDIRYGLGGWARVLESVFPKAKLYGLEADKTTLKKSYRPPKSVVVQGLFPYVPKSWPKEFDLILADFNDLTLLRMEPLLELLNIYDPVHVVFTDISSSKIHLNFSAYGLSERTTWKHLRPYYKKFKLRNHRYLGHSCLHYYASTAVFQRKKPR